MSFNGFTNRTMTLEEAFSSLEQDSKHTDLLQCKNAYKRLALQFHPDKNSADSGATTKFQHVSLAWSIVRTYLERGILPMTAANSASSTAAQRQQEKLDLNDVLRHPERYDLSELYYRMGAQRFFTFIRYVYAQSRQQGVRCPDCGRIHEPEYDDLAAAFYDELDATFEESDEDEDDDEDLADERARHHRRRKPRHPDYSDEENFDDDEEYESDEYEDDRDSEAYTSEEDEVVEPRPARPPASAYNPEDLSMLESWLKTKPDKSCDSSHPSISEKKSGDDLETKFFKYLFQQTVSDDSTNFKGFWNKFYPSQGFNNETDQERQNRIKLDLEQKRNAEERRRNEKISQRESKNRQVEQEKQASEARRKAKKKQKEAALVASQLETQKKLDEAKREAQSIRSETFRQAKSGNGTFVRDAVYRRGVAAEGYEMLSSQSGTNTPTGASPGSSKAKSGTTQETLLHLAVRNGDLSLVEYLVGNGATPDEVSSSGLTPVHVGCIQNEKEIIRYFAENYPESLSVKTTKQIHTTKTDRYPLPLHMAVERYHLFCVKPLVVHGPAPSQSLNDYVKKKIVDEEKRRAENKALMKRLPIVWMVMKRLLEGNNSVTEQEMKEAEEAYAIQQNSADAVPQVTAPSLSTAVDPTQTLRKKKNKKGKMSEKDSEPNIVDLDLLAAIEQSERSGSGNTGDVSPNSYVLEQQKILEAFERNKVKTPSPVFDDGVLAHTSTGSATNEPSPEKNLEKSGNNKKARKRRQKQNNNNGILNPLPHLPPKREEPPAIVYETIIEPAMAKLNIVDKPAPRHERSPAPVARKYGDVSIKPSHQHHVLPTFTAEPVSDPIVRPQPKVLNPIITFARTSITPEPMHESIATDNDSIYRPNVESARASPIRGWGPFSAVNDRMSAANSPTRHLSDSPITARRPVDSFYSSEDPQRAVQRLGGSPERNNLLPPPTSVIGAGQSSRWSALQRQDLFDMNAVDPVSQPGLSSRTVPLIAPEAGAPNPWSNASSSWSSPAPIPASEPVQDVASSPGLELLRAGSLFENVPVFKPAAERK